MLPDSPHGALHGLLADLTEGLLGPEESAALTAILRTDPSARAFYHEYMEMHSLLQWHHASPLPGPALDPCDYTPEDRSNVRGHRGDCPNFCVSKNGTVPFDAASLSHSSLPTTHYPLPTALGYFSSGWPVAYLVAAVICGVGLLIGASMHVSTPVQVVQQPAPLLSPLSPLTSFVGRITGMVDCQWEKTGTDPLCQNGPKGAEHIRGLSPFSPGAGGEGLANSPRPSDGRGAGGEGTLQRQSPVHLHDRFALASGLMEITYDTGAKVIVQGPAVYEVDSASGGFLSVGKLTAKVEKKAESGKRKAEVTNPQSLIPNPLLSTTHYPLFTVKTPTATVTDLGTEFGVEVTKEGNTTSHVFRGSVRVQMLGGDGNPEDPGQVLHENESARVEKNTGKQEGGNLLTVFVTPAKQGDFVREIPRDIPKPTIRIFDLVDVVAGGDGFSGRRGRGIDPTSGQATDSPPPVEKFFRLGDGKYRRVPKLPLVDGVFIPAGGTQPAQVDSAGHTFAGWVNPTNNQTYGNIWAGGKVPAEPRTILSTKLGNIDYATPGHGLIFLHANSGITFDLAAIRRANPNQRLVRFCAMTGNTESISEKLGIAGADVWVLIDGHLRFGRREINGCSGAFSVAIPIDANDRFLTLASTDGGNGIYCDWIIFGDPRLEMVSRKHLE